MRHSPRRLYPRTAAMTFLVDRVLHPPVESLDEKGIAASRSVTYPNLPPFTWIVGRVPRGVTMRDASATARDGREIPLRVYRPRATGVLPVIVFFHGGGWVTGGVREYDPICAHLAHHVGAVVVSVDYRLAPEHKAPTAAYDCFDATAWVAANGAALEADTTRLAVTGDSAGGNLSAVVCQLARDQGGPAIAFQGLVYPGTDMTLSSPSMQENAHAPVLTHASILAYRAMYLAEGHDLTDPLVSPLHGRHEDLPPALIQTAALDPLRDDGSRYAAALQAAGVPVRLTEYERVPHGFMSFPGGTPTGGQHRAELVEQMRQHLGR